MKGPFSWYQNFIVTTILMGFMCIKWFSEIILPEIYSSDWAEIDSFAGERIRIIEKFSQQEVDSFIPNDQPNQIYEVRFRPGPKTHPTRAEFANDTHLTVQVYNIDQNGREDRVDTY